MACRLFGAKPLSETMLPYCQYKETHLKMLCVKLRPYFLGFNVLTHVAWGDSKASWNLVNIYSSYNLKEIENYTFKIAATSLRGQLIQWHLFIYLFIATCWFLWLLSSFVFPAEVVADPNHWSLGQLVWRVQQGVAASPQDGVDLRWWQDAVLPGLWGPRRAGSVCGGADCEHTSERAHSAVMAGRR